MKSAGVLCSCALLALPLVTARAETGTTNTIDGVTTNGGVNYYLIFAPLC